jgi:hypothetical protein
MNKSPSDILTADYLAALRFHVEKDTPATLVAAHDIGQTAVKHGIETLKMANMHEQAMELLLPTETSLNGQKELTRKASAFFAEAIMPIEGTHRAARADRANFEQLNTNLRQRTADLAESNRELKVQIDERKSVETALKASEHSSSQLLRDSQLLERNLKDMTREILSATENERYAMSLRLNDEIAQTLLGINIRMIALKNEIAANHVNHNHEIDMIQQLVEDSAEMIKCLAYEFSDKHT